MNKKERMAFALAQQAHKGQLRKGKNKDYITHPIKVYKILKGLTDKEDVYVQLCSMTLLRIQNILITILKRNLEKGLLILLWK